MGLFDKMKQATAATGGNQTVTFTFQALPESLAQMQELPEASLDTPFKAAALTVCALCAYGADKNIGKEMLNWLRGPRPLNGQDISFLNDRFRDGKSYIPFSYFVGASPENGYTPRQPFTLLVGSNHTASRHVPKFLRQPRRLLRHIYLRLIKFCRHIESSGVYLRTILTIDKDHCLIGYVE